MAPPLRESVDTLLSQCLLRRLPQSKWVSYLHQLLQRSDKTGSTVGIATDVILTRVLAQHAVDPLLLEYLQAFVYGSATQDRIEPDQGPIADVMTVTLHFLSQTAALAQQSESRWLQQISTVDAIANCIGQGLMFTLQGAAAFQADNAAFLSTLRETFLTETSSATEHSDVGELLQCSLSFLMACLTLVALASQPTLSSATTSPQIGITLLVNVGQALLVHVYGRLLTPIQSTSREALLAPSIDLANKAATQIEVVLAGMDPAWANEIALLRSLSSQVNLIAEACITDTAVATDARSKGSVGVLAEVQIRATWDHFIDVRAIAIKDRQSTVPPPFEPEVICLLTLLTDHHVGWGAKLEAVKSCFLARRTNDMPSVSLEQSLTAFYFELFSATIEGCSTVLETPFTVKDAETCTAVWRTLLCGALPEIVSQLEQWLDANPDLPLRGQRQDAPHVRVETALKACFVAQADRLDICETVGMRSDLNAAGVIDVADFESPSYQPVKAWLLRACIEHTLARPEAIADEFPGGHKLASEVQNLPQSLRMDAQLEGLSLPACFETRFATDDPNELLRQVASEPGTLHAFARELTVQLRSWMEVRDYESIARWCRILADDIAFLDTLLIFVDPLQIVISLAGILDHHDMTEASDDPSTLAAILLFVQLVCYRFDISSEDISSQSAGAQPFLSTYLSSPAVCYTLSDLSSEEKDLVGRWVQALFGNEGISDDLIQASLPKTLMKLSPLLFSQSITACIFGVIDLDTLRGGLSYFLQDLLSYALPGALQWLLTEVLRTPLIPILGLLASAGVEGNLEAPSTDGTLSNGLSRKANSRTVYVEVLALLLDTDSCPNIVRHLSARHFERFATSPRLQLTQEASESFSADAITARMKGFGTTTLRLRATSSWRRSLLARTPSAIDTAWPAFLDSGMTLAQELDRIGASDVARTLLRLLAVAEAGDIRLEKYLAVWCTLSPLARGQRHSILTVVNQLALAELPTSTSATAVVRFLVLLLGILQASDTVRAASLDSEDTSAGLFDEDEHQHHLTLQRASVSCEEVVSLICLKITRLRRSHATLWQAYVDAFKMQQDCFAPSTKEQIWSWFGLQES